MILRWTLKSLWHARLRVLGSVLSVSLAFLLVTTFRAVWQGETDQLVAYIEHAGADVWVMQPHVSNMHMATSFLSDGRRSQVERVDGVGKVSSILYLNTFVGAGDTQWFCYVVGVDEPGQLGGPWSMAAGAAFPQPGKAIVPAVMARLSGIELGDEVRIADRTLEVGGLSEGTFSVGNPITFVHATDLASLLSLVGYDSYLLAKAAPGTSPDELAARILREVDDVAALPTERFVENDRFPSRTAATVSSRSESRQLRQPPQAFRGIGLASFVQIACRLQVHPGPHVDPQDGFESQSRFSRERPLPGDQL